MNRNEAKLYIHSGLHKTGTTALQFFLRNNTEALRDAGILYPDLGCPMRSIGNGHHNIAWQLARDRRFDRALGGVEALAGHIGNFSGDVLLSSEGFESSLGNPGAFSPLVQYATSTQRKIVIILYVRNQISYLESLYCELLAHGLGEEYRLVANQVIAHQEYSIREWVFHFDYLRIARRFASLRDIRFVFRSFHTLTKGSICADFCSLLPSAPALTEKFLHLRLNERASPSVALSRFYRNRVNRALSDSEIEVIEYLCQGKKWPMKPGRALYDSFGATFLKANKRFGRDYRVPVEGLTLDRSQEDPTIPSVLIDRFFSFETQCAIREIASRRAHPDLSGGGQTAVTALEKEAIEAWWTNRAPELPVALTGVCRAQVLSQLAQSTSV
jgi:hypothetical protein